MIQKKFLTACFILLFCAAAYAEESAEGEPSVSKRKAPAVLISGTDLTLSGYGGVYSRYSEVGETEGWFAGGRAGLIVNDNFSFGAAGMGLVTPSSREEISGHEYSGLYDTVEFGYGGFLAEYYINPKSLVNFQVGVLVGGGGLVFSYDTEDDDDDDDNTYGNDKIFVAEPELNVFVNLTRFCRLGVGVSYRYVTGIGSEEIENADFNGPAASAMVQFGWF